MRYTSGIIRRHDVPKKGGIANVMVSGSVTTSSGIRELNSSRSDPMMRSFEDEGS